MKYIFVSGGVFSGVGKGTVVASLGVVLKSNGFVITHLKIDPYLNYNAGLMGPCEHGEVFVLNDGTECDIDLGNYERFSGLKLSKKNCITGGGVLYDVITKEKNGEYFGKTVQLNPHVIDEIINRIEKLANTPVEADYIKKGVKVLPDIILIELGGTVGEPESVIYTEALAKLQNKVKKENCAFISVDHLVELESGEQKTKPIQVAAKNFRKFGLQQDIIVCRSKGSLTDESKRKIARNCWLKEENVFYLPTLPSVYKVPSFLESQGIFSSLQSILNLEHRESNLETFKVFERLTKRYQDTVRIGVVAKYFPLHDCYSSLVHALHFSGAAVGVNVEVVPINAESIENHSDSEFAILERVDGILIPGGFGQRGVEGKIKSIKYGRVYKVPLFGICLGYQLSIIEMSRDLLEISDAASEEFDPEASNLVIKYITDENGVADRKLRVGNYGVRLTKDGIVKKAYEEAEVIHERHRHRFEVAKEKVIDLENHGVKFVGKSTDGNITKIFEVEGHPFFVGVQFHPEFKARPNTPHPLITAFIQAAYNESKKKSNKN